MKHRDILNKLKLEVESCMPQDVLNNVKNTKVEKDLSPIYEQINNDGTKVKTNFKLISATMALTMLWFMMLISLAPILNSYLNPEPIITSKLGIDINPSIELLLDQNDNVVLTMANNRHAEILLADEDLTGLSSVEATNKIVSLATRAGYITTQNSDDIENAVLVSVASDDEDKKDELLKELKTEINNYYLANQIYGVVLTQFESKQELVDLVYSLNPEFKPEQKQELLGYSVKNLNQLLHDSYTNLKHRFRQDFALENFTENIMPIQDDYLKEVETIDSLLTTVQTRLSNFDALWQQDLQLSREKISNWKQELDVLTISLETETDEAKIVKTNQDIDVLTKFIESEQNNLTERENGKGVFDFYKNQLQSKIDEYQAQLKQEYENYRNNLSSKLSVVKDDIKNAYLMAKERKISILKNNEQSLSSHLNNKCDYNEFYTNYNNWVVKNVAKTNNLKENWNQQKAVWEQKFANYINF